MERLYRNAECSCAARRHSPACVSTITKRELEYVLSRLPVTLQGLPDPGGVEPDELRQLFAEAAALSRSPERKASA